MGSLQFLFHGRLLVVRQVTERRTVGPQIQTDQFHDPFATDNITPIAADHVDHLLREVLSLTGRLQVAGGPGLQDTGQLLTVVIGRTTNAPLRATHRQAGQNRLILAMQHIKLPLLI